MCSSDLLTLQYVLPWSEAGILDTEANNEVVTDLGKDTFAPGALAMANYDGETAAVPSDGWTQMVLYRKDLFDAAGLEAPNSYANITKALEKLHNPPEMYGFVAATKIDENFMSQVLEHVLLANGAPPDSANGSVGFDKNNMSEACDFYKYISKDAPPGDPFWNDTNYREITRYEASAEVLLGRGAKPDDANAFDARDVVTNLGPRIVRPEAQ